MKSQIRRRLSDGHHENFGSLRVPGQVLRCYVTERDGCQLFGQEQRDRLAGNFRRANDHRLGALNGDASRLDQLDHGKCSARRDESLAIYDVADIGGIDAFDILHDIDLMLEPLRVQPGRQREMHHDSGDGQIVIELADGLLHVAHACVGGQLKKLVVNSDIATCLRLPLGIKLAGRGSPNEDRGELNRLPARAPFVDALSHVTLDLCRNCASVDDLGGHRERLYADSSLARYSGRGQGEGSVMRRTSFALARELSSQPSPSVQRTGRGS